MAGKPLILMVEDNELDVSLLREALNDASFDVDIVSVGTCFEAVTFLERAGKHRDARRPDAILIDLNLPMDSGDLLLAFLARTDHFRAIPAAAYSSAHARLAGDAVFLPKPDSFDRFDHVVDWLRGSCRTSALEA